MKKEIVAILGGTFSPPHIGHVRAAEALQAALQPDRLMIIVDNLPPHKEIDGGASAEQRLKMASLAFGHIPGVEISDMEIRRGGRSFTADTLTLLSREDRDLYFLCGTDMFLSLPTWRTPEIIFEKATICLVRRESDGEKSEEIARAKADYERRYGARVRIIDAPVTEVSSTELRDQLKRAPWLAEENVPAAVLSYIEAEGLWPPEPSEVLSSLRQNIARFMGEKRYLHTLGVEKMAKKIAACFEGEVDPLSLGAAALLHDITKEMGEAEQRETAEKLGLVLTESQARSPAILHSFTAEYRIRKDFPYFAKNESVLRAIRAHTTGAKNMSLLDKILFVSDYIEEGREYSKCIETREWFFSEIASGADPKAVLDRCVLKILDSTVHFLRARGYALCEDTLDARNALLSTISSN
jgi:nicotinate-nucleotide adenylyltransferase